MKHVGDIKLTKKQKRTKKCKKNVKTKIKFKYHYIKNDLVKGCNIMRI